MASLRPLAAPLGEDGVCDAEMDAQSADVQRVLAMRRRRAAVLAQLQASHAAHARPPPLWLSLMGVALMAWLTNAISQRLWGLEDVPVTINTHEF
jgi:hypothetical protein